MVHRAARFTPQVMLSAPRRSHGIPNSIGTLVLYTTSTYSFETHSKTSEARVLNVKTGESRLLSRDEGISDLTWLDDETFVFLKGGKDGETKFYIANANKAIDAGGIDVTDAKSDTHYLAGSFGAPASNLKIKVRPDLNSYAVVVSALASPDGTLFNAKQVKKTRSTGRLYTKLWVRHWDRYEEKARDALWYAQLSRHGKGDQFALSKFTNAIPRLGLECPISTFGGTDNFDVSATAIILVAKHPKKNLALNTDCEVYVINIGDDWAGAESQKSVHSIPTDEYEGAATSPVFSADGRYVAFLKMKTNGYEADRQQIFLGSLADINASAGQSKLQLISEHWKRSASSLAFGRDPRTPWGGLLITAEDEGISKLFVAGNSEMDPTLASGLSVEGSIADVRALKDGRVFVSGSSLTDNSFYAIGDPTARADQDSPTTSPTWKNSNSAGGSKFGLHHGQVSSIWTPASKPEINSEVHSWVIRPSDFQPGKQYPVAYLIHGGPQSAWADSWSTRWNPAVFAEQGYIVIAPNPTGSTGYGPKFTDAIRQNWGGSPYEDIVNIVEWVDVNIPEADNSRAVALGGSYGGYMINWIQGHALGRQFRALVCHDGVTSFAGGQLSTDELYFPFHDLGGTPWYSPSVYSAPSSTEVQVDKAFGEATISDWRKWDPSEHFSAWATPQLVIHSQNDYRLPIGEGLAAFNVLQARGVESQFLMFPDENHWVLKPENSLVWHKTVLNWINGHVGLPLFATEDLESEEYFGGRVEEGKDEESEMPTIGALAI